MILICVILKYSLKVHVYKHLVPTWRYCIKIMKLLEHFLFLGPATRLVVLHSCKQGLGHLYYHVFLKLWGRNPWKCQPKLPLGHFYWVWPHSDKKCIGGNHMNKEWSVHQDSRLERMLCSVHGTKHSCWSTDKPGFTPCFAPSTCLSENHGHHLYMTWDVVLN